ncbi:MAG: hydroxymethylbilane synthase [Acidobacteria bacterium]|nr:hydroxymethylbilane synthase [Acidobacteriota bacterium]
MVVIGSRGSQLALWQARHVQQLLAAQGLESRIEVIQTTGDRITGVSLARLGAETSTKGLFTKELEEALLARTVDLAVHSLKDMPTELPAGLALAAVPEREAPFDAVIGRRLAELPAGARVGTSALRRQAQLLAVRADLDVQPVRGNLDTRLRKLDEGQYESIILAQAGLRRLGWDARIAEVLPASVMCPAAGQGALAIEARLGDERFAFLNHAASRAAVDCERAVLRALGGGCQVPIGAHALVLDGALRVDAAVIAPDGRRILRQTGSGETGSPELLGQRVAQALLDAGARELLA